MGSRLRSARPAQRSCAQAAPRRTQRSEYDRAETIEETAELVTELGGTGVAIAVDHLEPDQVQRLAEQIRRDHGHIDVLVNDIWGAEILKGGPAEWNTPIWEHDLEKGLRILRLAIDTHLITSHHLLPLLVDEPGGLLVEVTDGTSDYNASTYRISVFYDLAKVAVNRLAFSQGHELEPFGATAVAITPGLAALRDHARRVRRHRGELARRGRAARLRALRVAALRRPRRRRDGVRPRPCVGGTNSRSVPVSSHSSTASAT